MVHCGRNKDERISVVLQLPIRYGHTCIGWLARTYLVDQLYPYTEYSLEDLPRRWMIGTDEERESERQRETERESGKSMLSAWIQW